MDIDPYFNSAEIAAHCRKLGKKFWPWEKQILIAISYLPLEDRLQGYRELLTEAEGVSLPTEVYRDGNSDLPRYLQDILINEQRKIDRFLSGHPAIGFYRAKAIEQGQRYSGGYHSPVYQSMSYRSSAEALADLRAAYTCDKKSKYFHYTISYEEIGTGFVLTADIGLDGSFNQITGRCPGFEEPDEKTLLYMYGNFSLPTPFAKGDLVKAYDGFRKVGELYVVDEFVTFSPDQYGNYQKNLEHGQLAFYGYCWELGCLRVRKGITGYDTLRSMTEKEYMALDQDCNVLMAVKSCIDGEISLASFAHVVNYAEYTSTDIGKAFFALHDLEV